MRAGSKPTVVWLLAVWPSVVSMLVDAPGVCGQDTAVDSATDPVLPSAMIDSRDRLLDVGGEFDAALPQLIELLDRPSGALSSSPTDPTGKSGVVARLDQMSADERAAFETRYGPSAASILQDVRANTATGEQFDRLVRLYRWTAAGREAIAFRRQQLRDAGVVSQARQLERLLDESLTNAPDTDEIPSKRFAIAPSAGWSAPLATADESKIATVPSLASGQRGPVVVREPGGRTTAFDRRSGRKRWTTQPLLASDRGRHARTVHANDPLSLAVLESSIGLRDGGNPDFLLSLELSTGRLQSLIAGGASSTAAGPLFGYEVICDPVAFGKQFAVVARRGSTAELVIVDSESGETSFSQPLPDWAAGERPVELAVLGGTVIVSDGEGVAAVSPQLRHLLWQDRQRSPRSYARWARPESDRPIGSRPVKLRASWRSGGVVVTTNGRTVVCRDAATGAVRWIRPIVATSVDCIGPESVVVIGPQSASALDLKTGEANWELPQPTDTWSGHGVLDGPVWRHASASGEVVSVDLASGTVQSVLPIASEQPVSLYSTGGNLFAASPDRLWRLPTIGEVEQRISESDEPAADRLRSILDVESDQWSTAADRLSTQSTVGEAAAAELLVRILTSQQIDASRLLDYAASVPDSVKLPDNLDRKWLDRLASAHREAGNTVAEFATVSRLLMRNDRMAMQQTDWGRVQTRRLHQSRLAAIYEAAGAETRGELQDALAEVIDDVRDDGGLSDTRLRRIPRELLDPGVVRDLLAAIDVPVAERAAGWVGLGLDLPDEFRPADDDRPLVSKFILEAQSSLAVTSRAVPAADSQRPIIERVADRRFGPARLWRRNYRGELECLDRFGRPIAAVDPTQLASNDEPLAAFRVGRRTVIRVRNGVVIVDETRIDPEQRWQTLPFLPERSPRTGVRQPVAVSSASQLVRTAAGRIECLSFDGDAAELAWSVPYQARPDVLAIDGKSVVAFGHRSATVLDARTGRPIATRELPEPLPRSLANVAPGSLGGDPFPWTTGCRVLLRGPESIILYDPIDDVTVWTRSVDETDAIQRADDETLIIASLDGDVRWVRLADGVVLAAAAGAARESLGLASQVIAGGVIVVLADSIPLRGIRPRPQEIELVGFRQGNTKPVWQRSLVADWPEPQPPLWPDLLMRTPPANNAVRGRTGLSAVSLATGQVRPLPVAIPGGRPLSWISLEEDSIFFLARPLLFKLKATK